MDYESETYRIYETKYYFQVVINQIEYELWQKGTIPEPLLKDNKYYDVKMVSKEHSPPSPNKTYDNYHYHILLTRKSPVQTMKDNFGKALKNFTFNNHKFNVVRNYDHFKQIIPYILKDNNLLYYKEEDFISKSLVPDYKEPSASKKGNRKELMIEHVCSILEDRKQKGKKIKYIGIIESMIKWYMDNTPDHKAWSISNLTNLADRLMIKYTENGLNKYIGNIRNNWDE